MEARLRRMKKNVGDQYVDTADLDQVLMRQEDRRADSANNSFRRSSYKVRALEKVSA